MTQWIAIFCAAVLLFAAGAGAKGLPFTWHTCLAIVQAALIATLVVAWLSGGRGCDAGHHEAAEDCRPAGPGIHGC